MGAPAANSLAALRALANVVADLRVGELFQILYALHRNGSVFTFVGGGMQFEAAALVALRA